MIFLAKIIGGTTALGLTIFTIWAGFDWVHSYGSLNSTYWIWALGMMPCLVAMNAIWLFIED